jgi:NADH-quinone oxidoreductase subunit N
MTLPNINPAALSGVNLPVILPVAILVLASLVILGADLIWRDSRRLPAWLSLAAVAAAMAATILLPPLTPEFQTMATGDMLGRMAGVAILAAALLALLLSYDRVTHYTPHPGLYYALVVLATSGMLAMASGSDLMTIFIGLEILSLALYILVGIRKRDPRSSEASLKYFLLGAFASGFFLYGAALVYGAAGTTNLAQIAARTAPLSVTTPFAPLLPIGIGLLLVGYGFKVALVPFHMWTPDVYQGSPTAVTAFMSVATKTAVFVSLVRVLGAVVSYSRPWQLALAVIAVLTMTLGNLAALRQSSLKRMLAYSSIAHAGYILTGIVAGNATGVEGALYYLLAYTFMTFGAFAVLAVIERRSENDVTIERISGLARREPLLAALMSLFMFALIGIPPLAGFFGKLYVFSGAVEAGYVWLAVVGVINSAIAAYYYLRVTVAMYMGEQVLPVEDVRPRWAGWTAIGLAAVGVVALGIWQLPWLQAANQAIAQLVR